MTRSPTLAHLRKKRIARFTSDVATQRTLIATPFFFDLVLNPNLHADLFDAVFERLVEHLREAITDDHWNRLDPLPKAFVHRFFTDIERYREQALLCITRIRDLGEDGEGLVVASNDPEAILELASKNILSPKWEAFLATHPNIEVRQNLARRPIGNITIATQRVLVRDPSDAVVHAFISHQLCRWNRGPFDEDVINVLVRRNVRTQSAVARCLIPESVQFELCTKHPDVLIQLAMNERISPETQIRIANAAIAGPPRLFYVLAKNPNLTVPAQIAIMRHGTRMAWAGLAHNKAIMLDPLVIVLLRKFGFRPKQQVQIQEGFFERIDAEPILTAKRALEVAILKRPEGTIPEGNRWIASLAGKALSKKTQALINFFLFHTTIDGGDGSPILL